MVRPLLIKFRGYPFCSKMLYKWSFSLGFSGLLQCICIYLNNVVWGWVVTLVMELLVNVHCFSIDVSYLPLFPLLMRISRKDMCGCCLLPLWILSLWKCWLFHVSSVVVLPTKSMDPVCRPHFCHNKKQTPRKGLSVIAHLLWYYLGRLSHYGTYFFTRCGDLT